MKNFQVIIPLADPHREKELITIGAAVALYNRGEAVALNILPQPPQENAPSGKENMSALIEEQNRSLAEACRHTAAMGIKTTPVTLFSSRIQETIIKEARTRNASMIIMGWSKPSSTPGAVMGKILDSVMSRAPVDMAVLRNRGLGKKRVLLSTAGGPESNLGGLIAAALQKNLKASITLLHLVRNRDDMQNGKTILNKFARKHRLKARRIIKAREDFSAGILEESEFYDLIIVGSSQTGLLKRIFFRTIPEKVVEQAKCSVLVTRRHGRLPFLTYLFGHKKS